MGSTPDFAVIGAARSGTRAIGATLRQSADVFVPEGPASNFFAFEGEALAWTGPGAERINRSITTVQDYRKRFASAPKEALKGEVAPLYLYSSKAPANAARHAPGMRIVVILRNPIEQAYAQYLFARKHALEKDPDFKRALMKEHARIQRGWQPLFGYSTFPRYGTQIRRWMKHFPQEQMFIRTYDELQHDPKSVMSDMAKFIGITTPFTPELPALVDNGGHPRNAALQRALTRRESGFSNWLAGLNTRPAEPMNEDARDVLRERLAGEIMEVGRILGRDMRYWLD